MPKTRLLAGSLALGAVIAGGAAIALYPDAPERESRAVEQELQANTQGAPQPGAPGVRDTETTLIDVTTAAPAIGQHGNISVAKVGLDLPIYEQEFSSTLIPGDGKHAWAVVDEEQGWYWSDEGTRLVIMHSSPYRADTPGNPLTKNGQPAVTGGDQIVVEGNTYQVNSTTVVPKNGLKDLDIWHNVPGQLIVITCYPMDGEKSSPANVVIIAQKIA